MRTRARVLRCLSPALRVSRIIPLALVFALALTLVAEVERPTASAQQPAVALEKLDAQLRLLVSPPAPAVLRGVAPGSPAAPQAVDHAAALSEVISLDLGARVPTVDVLVETSGADRELQGQGARVLGRVGNIVALRVPIASVAALSSLPSVVRIEAAALLSPLNDDAGADIGAIAARTPSPGSDGAGVVVAVIDSGIDIFHQDFRNADGTTRVRALLDLSVAGPGPGGGVAYTESQINAELASPGSTVPLRDFAGHGSHVAGSAAGDGSATDDLGQYAGIAPRADLVIVKGGDLVSSTFLLAALDFIDEQAAILGRPWVTNMSFGTNLSPHDGTTLLEQAIDSVTGPANPGQVVVVAAGNEGQIATHARTELVLPAPGETLTSDLILNIPAGLPSMLIEVWYDGDSDLQTGWITPTGIVMPYEADPFPDGETTFACAADSNDGPSTCGTVYHGSVNPLNGDKVMLFSIHHVDSNANRIPLPSGTWTFQFEAVAVAGDGRFDAYLHEGCGGCRFSSLVATSRLRSPGTANNAITVGSYITDTSSDWGGTLGAISDFSSPGPTRDGRLKPEIIAPGQGIYSTESGDYYLSDGQPYRYSSGTSMATPMVTGAVALLLQADSTLDSSEVRTLLVETARTDGFTGGTPNDLAGFGKVDVLAALARLLRTDADESLVVGSDTAPADGATIGVIEVRLRSASGKDVVGHQVSLAGVPGSSTVSPSIVRTGADGIALFEVTSAVPGPVAYTATDITDGVVVTEQHTVTFVDGGGGDSTLVALTLDQGVLAPIFQSSVRSYTAHVLNEVSSVAVTAVTGNPLAMLEIDHGSASSGTPSVVSLAVGPNPIPVVVAAEDGSTTTTTMVTVVRAGSGPAADTTLSSLTFLDWPITPAFDPNTTEYSISVPYDNGAVFPSATVGNPAASMLLDGWYWHGSNGDVGVLPGTNVFEIVVTAADGFSRRTYTIHATRGVPPDPGDSSAPVLAAFDFEAKSVDTGSSSAVISFTAQIADPSGLASGYQRPRLRFTNPSGTTSIYGHFDSLIAGTETDGTFSGALTLPRYSETGTWALDSLVLTDSMRNAAHFNETDLIGLGYPTALEVTGTADTLPPSLTALEVAPLSVTSANGRVPIVVTVSLDDDLSGVSLSGLRSGVEFEPVGPPPNGYGELELVSGAPLSGVWTSTAWLPPTTVSPPGVWELSVDLWDAVSNRDHVFASELSALGFTSSVTVLPSDDASLRVINLSAGLLAPGFDPEVVLYEVGVENAVDFLGIAVLTSHVGATLTIDGVAATSGIGESVALEVGTRSFEIVVTAQDGGAQRAYELIVTRAEPPPSDDATLAALTLGAGTLAPSFEPGTAFYTATVGNGVSAVGVTATTADSAATLTIDGGEATNGVAEPIELVVGANGIDVVVTAEDGSTEITYTVTVTRAAPAASDDATLGGLTLSAGMLEPSFAAGTLSYSADVGNEVSSVDVTATTNHGGATLTVDGVAAGSGDATSVALSVGANAIDVVVTAEDGVTEQPYTVTVTRAASEGGGGGGGGGFILIPPPPPPQLRVDVTVTNDDGGEAVVGDFVVLVNDETELVAGETALLTYGGQVVSLGGPTGFYSVMFGGACFEDGTVILLGGLSICTVELDDQPLAAVLGAPLEGVPPLIEELLSLTEDAFERGGTRIVEASSAGTPPEVTVAVPVGAIPGGGAITIVVSPANELAIGESPPPGALLIGGTGYVIEILDGDGNPITEFAEPLELSFLLPDGAGPVEAYYFDAELGLWLSQPGSVSDRRFDMAPTHLTTFALFEVAPGGGFTTALPPGTSLTVNEGGTLRQFREALWEAGASAAFVSREGRFIGYLPDAPEFVNDEFVLLFPAGIPPATVMIVIVPR